MKQAMISILVLLFFASVALGQQSIPALKIVGGQDGSVSASGMAGNPGAVSAQDSLALVALYNSTNGPGWTNNTNWLSANPVSIWYGVTVAGGRVTELKLNSNRLTGQMPSQMGNLNKLKELDLRWNQLSGPIPREIWSLTNLEGLELEGNDLSGQISLQIGNLNILKYLSLGQNQLNGSIPSQIGNLAMLIKLELDRCQLTGQIPSQIGNLTRLTLLRLSENQLSGRIPPEIGELTELKRLYLQGNQLSGSIPRNIGNLTNLIVLYLNSNQLSGSIPPEIGNLSSYVNLDLSSNKLSGQIPPEIGNLANSLHITLDTNQLTDFPDLSNVSFPNMEDFTIHQNRLTFEDIEPNIFVRNLYYAPQAKVGETKEITKTPGSSVTFSVSVGGTANQYQWYKDGATIVGATGSNYTINNLDFGDAGSYTCQITNTIVTRLTLVSNPQNLTVSTQAAPNLTIDAGNTSFTYDENSCMLTINTRVKNDGNGNAAASTLAYYLSTDPNIETSDSRIGTDNVGSLAPDSFSNESITQNLSSITGNPNFNKTGTYYVGVYCDYENAVSESDESDNDYKIGNSITLNCGTQPQPNLIIVTNSSSYNYDDASCSLTINTRVKNNGNANVAASTLAYYLSTDPNIETSDSRIGADNVGSLSPGGFSNESITQDLSSITGNPNFNKTGTYYVGVYCDYQNEVNESDESDNDYKIGNAITLDCGGGQNPVLSVSPMTLDFGASQTSLTFQISNSGSGALTWNVSESPDRPWMTSVSPASGSGNTTVTVSVDRSGLSSGNYAGRVTVTSNGGSMDVTVNMTVPGGGVTWENQVSGTQNRLTLVTATSDLVAWTGSVNGTVLRTTDGGNVWTNVSNRSAPFPTIAVAALDANTAFVSPWDPGSGNGLIYRTNNGGQSWTNVFQQTNRFINNITMFSQNEGIALGDPASGVWTILKTIDSGNNWTPIPNPPAAMAGDYSGPYNVVWTDQSTGWYGTNKSKSFHTSDGGTTWDERTIQLLPNVNSIAFNQLGVGLAEYYQGQLVRTFDGGMNWQAISPPGAGIIRFLLFYQNKFWLLRDNSIYNSQDNGSTWGVQTVANDNLRHLSFVTNQQGTHGWAVGDSGVILKYKDETAKPTTDITSASFDTRGNAEEAMYLYVNGNSAIDNDHRFADLTWYWSYRFDIADQATAAELTLRIAGHYVITGSQNHANWVQLDSVGQAVNQRTINVDISGLLHDNPSNTVFIKFHDGSPTDGWGPSLWHLTLSTSTVSSVEERETQIVDGFTLQQNYPNPFNPETRISYELAKQTKVVLKVMNLLGQEVRTLVDAEKRAGSHEVTWNGKDAYGRRVASGVYLYQLESKDLAQTRKMVLLR